MTTAMLMLNGVLTTADQAVVPATDRALTHGLGLYETLKLVDGLPVFFPEHVARLDLGLHELGLERPFTDTELARTPGSPRLAASLTAPAGCWSPPASRTADPPFSSRPIGGSSLHDRCASSASAGCACAPSSRP